MSAIKKPVHYDVQLQGVITEDGDIVCDIYDEHDADEIVRAVNCHDELVYAISCFAANQNCYCDHLPGDSPRRIGPATDSTGELIYGSVCNPCIARKLFKKLQDSHENHNPNP